MMDDSDNVIFISNKITIGASNELTVTSEQGKLREIPQNVCVCVRTREMSNSTAVT